MLDRRFVKSLNLQQCKDLLEDYKHESALAKRRLARLKAKQKRFPNFKSYNVWANEEVGIDIYIEEQTAVKDEMEWYRELLEAQVNALNLKQEFPTGKLIDQTTIQLNMFSEDQAMEMSL